jgi:hypothetical protein
MSESISNKTLVVLLVIAIGVSVMGIWVSVSKQNSFITGAPVVDQGTATVNIQALLAGTFTVNSLNSTLNITDETATWVQFDTDGTCLPTGNCTIGVGSLTFNNNGNVNASVNIKSDLNGTDVFAMLQGPLQIHVTESSNDCHGTLTEYVNVSTVDSVACTNLNYVNGADNLGMTVRANITTDQTAGTQQFQITATVAQV